MIAIAAQDAAIVTAYRWEAGLNATTEGASALVGAAHRSAPATPATAMPTRAVPTPTDLPALVFLANSG